MPEPRPLPLGILPRDQHDGRGQLTPRQITLQEPDLRAMDLDEDLLDAILEAKRLKKHGALRRQKQYIGKLMGRVDPEPIREALERLKR